MRSFIASLVVSFAVLTTPAVAQWDVCNNYRSPVAAVDACTWLIRQGTFQPMSDVYCARGIAYRFLNDLERAIADFNVAIQISPRDSISYGQRGMAYKLKGNYAQALADLQTAVALDGSNQSAAKELRALRGY